MTRPKPFYRFVERRQGRHSDRLVFQNDHDPKDRIEFSEWWFQRWWRFFRDCDHCPHPWHDGQCAGCPCERSKRR